MLGQEQLLIVRHTNANHKPMPYNPLDVSSQHLDATHVLAHVTVMLLYNMEARITCVHPAQITTLQQAVCSVQHKRH